MTQEELKEQIQIDLCTFLEIRGIEDNKILDQVCQIVVDNFKRASKKVQTKLQKN